MKPFISGVGKNGACSGKSPCDRAKRSPIVSIGPGEDVIREEEWKLYQEVLHCAQAQKIRYLIGGAFALAGYTGRWRSTKDLDLYVLPSKREDLIGMLLDQGFEDYYEQCPYDRKWIFRTTRNSYLVDVIWSFANQRAQVDEEWFEQSVWMPIKGESFPAIPPEELVWAKLYVLQRERCDWPDLMNLLYFQGETLDWDRLWSRVEGDAMLLTGALTVFCWLCPERVEKFPLSVRERIASPKGLSANNFSSQEKLLDSRPWFGSFKEDELSSVSRL